MWYWLLIRGISLQVSVNLHAGGDTRNKIRGHPRAFLHLMILIPLWLDVAGDTRLTYYRRPPYLFLYFLPHATFMETYKFTAVYLRKWRILRVSVHQTSRCAIIFRYELVSKNTALPQVRHKCVDKVNTVGNEVANTIFARK